MGQRYGTTTGTVIVNEVVNNQSVSHVYLWRQVCSNLTYCINAYSGHNTTLLYISSEIKSRSNVPYPLIINVTATVSILDCPPGFELSRELGTCVCDDAVYSISSTASCSISTQTITKQDNTWFGYDDKRQCIIAIQNCPFDYCTSTSPVTFTLSETDSQCAFERSGYLCGKCSKGSSLILGANHCHKCSNGYLSLVIVFAVAGILLVTLLLVLNLTVAIGSMNGLIFH